jgi:hypothetical protein
MWKDGRNTDGDGFTAFLSGKGGVRCRIAARSASLQNFSDSNADMNSDAILYPNTTVLESCPMTRHANDSAASKAVSGPAHAVFMQKGYALTSVEDISTAAGCGARSIPTSMTRTSSSSSCCAAGESIDRGFERILDGGLTDPAALRDALAVQYSALYRDDKCNLLWMEARIVALRDEKFRAARYLPGTALQPDHLLRSLLRPDRHRPAAPREIAIGLMALCRVRFFYRCVPHIVDGKTAESVLAWFLKASVAVAAPGDHPPAGRKGAKQPTTARRKSRRCLNRASRWSASAARTASARSAARPRPACAHP